MKNNEQIIWAKVVLSSYGYLEKLCNTIDALVETTAKNSMFTNSYWQSECSILNVYKKIKKLSDKKIDYINLKLKVEKTLKSLPLMLSKILILRHIHQLSIEEISKLLKLTSRTTYRKYDVAIVEFAKMLSDFGYSKEFLFVTFSDDTFISSVYSSISNCNVYCQKANNMTKDELFGKFLHDFKFKVV